MANRWRRRPIGGVSADAGTDAKGTADARRPRLLHSWGVVLVGVVLLTAALVALDASLGSAATGVPKPPSGWQTVFQDDFAGKAGRLDSKWTYDIGTRYSGRGCTDAWGTGEIETDTNAALNVSKDGRGHLDIAALKSRNSWSSGRIETVADDLVAPAGGEMEVTASIEQPDPAHGLGYWPAFWMLGAGFRGSGHGTSGTMICSRWPHIGEIDVMEDVNAGSEVSGTLHCGTDPGGPCNESVGLGSGLATCPRCQASFNTYSVVINRTNTKDESITWLLNGKAYYRVREGQIPPATWQAAVDHGFFLILDVAMGGSYPDAICRCTAPSSSTTSGAPMRITYVAVYTTKKHSS